MFLRPTPVAEGRYHYVVRGSSGSFTAELVRFPNCFGDGTTPGGAVQGMCSNLKMFVSDAATAKLEPVQQRLVEAADGGNGLFSTGPMRLRSARRRRGS